MTPTEYELFVGSHLYRFGFIRIEHTGKTGDFGADLIGLDTYGRKAVIQCKLYKKPVGVKAVQEVIAARQYYRTSRAIVVTNSTFTKSAKKLAYRCGVELLEKFH